LKEKREVLIMRQDGLAEEERAERNINRFRLLFSGVFLQMIRHVASSLFDM
jgi:hypothetical protein